MSGLRMRALTGALYVTPVLLVVALVLFVAVGAWRPLVVALVLFALTLGLAGAEAFRSDRGRRG